MVRVGGASASKPAGRMGTPATGAARGGSCVLTALALLSTLVAPVTADIYRDCTYGNIKACTTMGQCQMGDAHACALVGASSVGYFDKKKRQAQRAELEAAKVEKDWDVQEQEAIEARNMGGGRDFRAGHDLIQIGPSTATPKPRAAQCSGLWGTIGPAEWAQEFNDEAEQVAGVKSTFRALRKARSIMCTESPEMQKKIMACAAPRAGQVRLSLLMLRLHYGHFQGVTRDRDQDAVQETEKIACGVLAKADLVEYQRYAERIMLARNPYSRALSTFLWAFYFRESKADMAQARTRLGFKRFDNPTFDDVVRKIFIKSEAGTGVGGGLINTELGPWWDEQSNVCGLSGWSTNEFHFQYTQILQLENMQTWYPCFVDELGLWDEVGSHKKKSWHKLNSHTMNNSLGDCFFKPPRNQTHHKVHGGCLWWRQEQKGRFAGGGRLLQQNPYHATEPSEEMRIPYGRPAGGGWGQGGPQGQHQGQSWQGHQGQGQGYQGMQGGGPNNVYWTPHGAGPNPTGQGYQQQPYGGGGGGQQPYGGGGGGQQPYGGGGGGQQPYGGGGGGQQPYGGERPQGTVIGDKLVPPGSMARVVPDPNMHRMDSPYIREGVGADKLVEAYYTPCLYKWIGMAYRTDFEMLGYTIHPSAAECDEDSPRGSLRGMAEMQRRAGVGLARPEE